MYRAVGRSEDLEEGGGWTPSDVVGMICPPGLDRVNWFEKKWGNHAPPAPAPLAPALYYVATHAEDSGLGMVLKWSHKESGETYFRVVETLFTNVCESGSYIWFPINVWKLYTNGGLFDS